MDINIIYWCIIPYCTMMNVNVTTRPKEKLNHVPIKIKKRIFKLSVHTKPKERLNQQTNPVHKNNLEKNIQPTSTYKTEINIKPTFAYKTKPSKE